MVSATKRAGILSIPQNGKKKIKNFWYDDEKEEFVVVIEN